jgi:DNA modification methylase
MQVQSLPIDKIQPYDKNPRKNDRSVDTVARSISQYGFQQPIVVDRNHIIIVGHTRYRAAQQLEFKEVPVVVADTLTDRQAQAYRIMDNRASEDSRWHDGLLTEELKDLFRDDDLLDLSDITGFRQSELLKKFAKDAPPDLEKYAQDTQYRTQPGDVWSMGRHRLVCGDSTSAQVHQQLLPNEQIDCIWQDPPYGIAYETANGINYTKEENELRNHLIQNDSLSIEQLLQLIERQLTQLHPYIRGGTPIYLCHDIRFTQPIRDMLDRADFHISDVLIWKKNNASNWLSDYAKYYEPIFYGWRRGGIRPWHGKGMTPNTIDLDSIDQMSDRQIRKLLKDQVRNYHEFKKETRKIASLHPTVKPTTLIQHHLANSTQRDDIVFDGFAGSGSTVIACEQLGRTARVVELEPKFCDVIVRRWQDITEEKAYNQKGEPFDA